MGKHILMVDDQVAAVRPFCRMLEGDGYRVTLVSSGQDALLKVAQDKPDMVVVDVEMPGMDGFELVRRMRALRSAALIPILFLTGKGAVPDKVRGLSTGADDYLVKPAAYEELRARITAALARTGKALGANPLTGLPGNAAIEAEVTKRIQEGRPFALAYVDIDFFKSYNDAYGFAKGDEVLRALGRVLLDAVEKTGLPEDFVGHIGGDDFVLATVPESLQAVARHAMEAFDRLAPGFYSEEDRKSGGLRTSDRQGKPQFYPILRLSIGAVTTEKRRLSSYGEAAGVASEMKRFAKTIKRDGSFMAKDRRGE
jgi:diguanylate cyclase (GGDEF)-like protein